MDKISYNSQFTIDNINHGCGRECGDRISIDFVNTLLLGIQEDEVDGACHWERWESFWSRNRQVLAENHYLMTGEKTKLFLKFQTDNLERNLRKLEVGRRILALSDILEPGLSAHRGGIKIVTMFTNLSSPLHLHYHLLC